MATERLSMRKTREILRLKELKRSHREISRVLGVGGATVSEAAARARAAQLDWAAVSAIGDAEFDAALPEAGDRRRATAARSGDARHRAAQDRRDAASAAPRLTRAEPSRRGRVHAVLRAPQRLEDDPAITMRQVHLAGDKLFVDYSGKKSSIVDIETGESIEVELFVAVLGARAPNYTYAEVTRSQTVPDWVMSHVRALEYVQGVPAAIVPDQLKPGVTKSCRYEPSVQRT